MNIVEKSLKEGKENGDPLAVGQFSAVNQVLQIAVDDSLVPSSSEVRSDIDSNERFSWLKKIHSTMMMPIVLDREKRLEPSSITRHNVTNYRSTKKILGKNVMPSPGVIKKLMHNLMLDIIQFNNHISYKIKHPFMLSKRDLQDIAEKAYEVNLKICCIKPFEDGSNRTARLAENALRLYWGLPWKVISVDEKDRYLNDIFEMQKNFPENPKI